MEADVWSPLGSSSWSATSACGRGLWLPASACGRVRSCVSEPKASTSRKDRACPMERGRLVRSCESEPQASTSRKDRAYPMERGRPRPQLRIGATGEHKPKRQSLPDGARTRPLAPGLRLAVAVAVRGSRPPACGRGGRSRPLAPGLRRPLFESGCRPQSLFQCT
jgi:hypothetical protein